MLGDNSDSEFGFRFVIITWETEGIPRNVWWDIVGKRGPLWEDKDIKREEHIFGERKIEIYKRIIEIEILEWNIEIFSQIEIISKFIVRDWFA